MDFARSTQAKSWLFDEQSLTACRQRAATFESSPRARPWEKVRKFASGFRHLHSKKASDQEQQTKSPADLPSSPELSVEDQEALVQFHSHQMQTLVGPTAILPELRTSETVHSTAITFLRRFYLSNSVVEFRPRRMAVACAFIAAKVEEERIHIDLLSHATGVVQMRAENSSLYRQELGAVSIVEIQMAELVLLEGLNYELRCFNASSAVQNLATDLSAYRAKKAGAHSGRLQRGGYSCPVDFSPRCLRDYSSYDREGEDVARRARQVAERALIFSDAVFLFAPGHIAFAITAIVTGCVTKDGFIVGLMSGYLSSLFPPNSNKERFDFLQTIRRVVKMLVDCPMMDLQPTNGRAPQIVAHRAEELRRVFQEVARVRFEYKRKAYMVQSISYKRTCYEIDFAPPRSNNKRKMARVTPVNRY